MAATATRTRPRDQGKSMFVKEFLNDHPQATHKFVSEAWTKAGMDGTVSETLVSRVRSELGLAGNARKVKPASENRAAAMTKSKTKGMKKASPKPTPAPQAKPSRSHRGGVLEEVEVGIDRLIFRLAEAGGFGDLEDGLRRVRRQLIVRSHSM
jgi:hypothetical protein